mmetsp:Transcript_84537/g.236034  ORF Transcript_84537/g.236034 Transcript_84537/m.236034 type:complete len:215 (-) Transcript_84537:48-692(-)
MEPAEPHQAAVPRERHRRGQRHPRRLLGDTAGALRARAARLARPESASLGGLEGADLALRRSHAAAGLARRGAAPEATGRPHAGRRRGRRGQLRVPAGRAGRRRRRGVLLHLHGGRAARHLHRTTAVPPQFPQRLRSPVVDAEPSTRLSLVRRASAGLGPHVGHLGVGPSPRSILRSRSLLRPPSLFMRIPGCCQSTQPRLLHPCCHGARVPTI